MSLLSVVGNWTRFLCGFVDTEMNMLDIAHKKSLKTAGFCTQVYVQFFTVLFSKSNTSYKT